MTPEEALNKLDETLIGDLELKIVLSKALEKQVAKKVVVKKFDFLNLYYYQANTCPVCNATANRYIPRKETYCHKCGQKIDWEV